MVLSPCRLCLILLFMVRNRLLITVLFRLLSSAVRLCCSCGVCRLYHLCEAKRCKIQDGPVIVIGSNRDDDSAFFGATFVHLRTIQKDLSMIHQES